MLPDFTLMLGARIWENTNQYIASMSTENYPTLDYHEVQYTTFVRSCIEGQPDETELRSDWPMVVSLAFFLNENILL